MDVEGDGFDLLLSEWNTEDEHPACKGWQGDGENSFLGCGSEFLCRFQPCIDHLFLRHDDFDGVWWSSRHPAPIQDFNIELEDFNGRRGRLDLSNLEGDFSQFNNGLFPGEGLGRTLSYPYEG